ncbi:S1 RNA-binding domain-containing protein [uncultured Clostridium sp.]|uniref:S1 RNA-binding domain-containing protein n=1 Tax=uncultured Clostridium sp. TaxID=59620 RepID=UPI0028E36A1E|nr:S1 RNA-binding domain-containing protein [uncultured Clostridium sp.]
MELIKLDAGLSEQVPVAELLLDSRSEAIRKLRDGLRTGALFEAFCTKCDREGNLTVVINGIECTMDRNEVSIPSNGSTAVHKGLCQKKVGFYIKAKVISIKGEERGGKLEVKVSRKHYVQALREYYIEKLQVGSLIEGKVTNIDESQGVFVDIGGDIVGIIPKEYLENLYVVNMTDHISIGESVDAIVLDVEKKDNDIVHLSLDRKSTLPDFNKLSKNYHPGDVVLAKIKSITITGIYCALDKHLDILADFNNNGSYKAGQTVRVRIRKIRADKKRITGVIEGKI